MKAGQAKKWMKEKEGEGYSWRKERKMVDKDGKLMKQQIRVDYKDEYRMKELLESEQMQKMAEEMHIYILGEGKLEGAVEKMAEEVYQKCSGV